MRVGSRNSTKSRHPFYVSGLPFASRAVARAGLGICIIEQFSVTVTVVEHEDR